MNFSKGHKDFFSLLDKHIEPQFFDLMGAGPSAPEAGEILAFATEAGVRLPDDFISFSVSALSGLYLEVKQEFWPPAEPYDIRPEWAFCSGLYVYGFAPETPDFMNIRQQAAEFREQGQTFVPCLSIVSDADPFGFRADGTIGRWNHETDAIESVDLNFIDLLDREIGELAQRQRQMAESGGKFED